jgi:hypothetical protein
MEEILSQKGILRRSLIGAAKTLVVESRPMLDFTLSLLQADAWHLVRSEVRPQEEFSRNSMF